MSAAGPAEINRRLRAAWAYSCLDQKELAETAGVHIDTLRRLLARTGPAAATIEQQRAVETACGLDGFVEFGFDVRQPATVEPVAEQLGRLAARVRELELREAARALEERKRRVA